MDIEVFFLEESESFLDSLDNKARKKIFSDIRKTQMGLRGEWFRKMPGTEEIWEFRTLYNKTYYRIFAFWQKKGNKETLIICTSGLVKKTDKTPPGEIERAERLRREYLGSNKKV